MGAANERQIGGTHYKVEGAVEHWDIVAQWGLDYFQGQITKYVMRWKKKGGIQDLEKARHFLDKYMELEKAKAEEEGKKSHPAMAMHGSKTSGGSVGGGSAHGGSSLTSSD